jgi:hypothetical protein
MLAKIEGKELNFFQKLTNNIEGLDLGKKIQHLFMLV